MSPARPSYRQCSPVLALILLLGAGCAPAAIAGETTGTGPRWPLDLPARWLTSNFMEYRGGRFHAGLDLKTRETEGFPAFAAEDGWISRLRATPGGYGRAVYLRGVSGRTYVYAHLGRFSDRLAVPVRAAQERDGRYRVELEFVAGQLPVTRGEVLGLTGQSGTLGPHLHFEVRDETGLPIDPLAAGFAVRDTIAPVIRHVRVLPAAADASIEGATVARRLPVAGQAWDGGRAPPLTVCGPVAFSASIVEATDPAGHRLEPWLIELRLDGELVYRRANERFAFEANAQQRLEWLECGGLKEQWLHRDPAVTVDGRAGGPWFRGGQQAGLAPGRHDCELTATDRAGNRSLVAWDLVVRQPGTDEPPLTPSKAWLRDPVGIGIDDNQAKSIMLTPLFEVFPDGLEGLAVQRVTPATDGAALAPLTVVATTTSVADAGLVAQAAAQGLETVGWLVRWDAASWPVEGVLVVDVPQGIVGQPWEPVAGDDPQLLLYRWSGTRWEAAGPVLAPEHEGGPFRFALGGPGLYRALTDPAPPVIDTAPAVVVPHAGVMAGTGGVTPPRWALLAVGLSDAGAGVDAGSIAARWDGRPLIIEPDLLRDRVLVEIPDSTRAGEHVLEIEAVDGGGLAAQARIRVRCVAAPGG